MSKVTEWKIDHIGGESTVEETEYTQVVEPMTYENLCSLAQSIKDAEAEKEISWGHSLGLGSGTHYE